MAILPPNSFYKAFKGSGSGYVPARSAAPAGPPFGYPQRGFGGGIIPSQLRPGPPRPPGAPGAPSSGGGGGSAPSTGGLQGFTPTAGGLPPDPIYQQTIAGIDKGTGDTVGNLEASRAQGLASYGYNATYDANGNVTGVTYDPNNPYSQASLLRTHYQQAKTGNTTSYAARGQLYAGSLQNAQNATTESFNAGDSSLKSRLIGFLTSNQGQITSAQNTGITNKGTALGESVARAPTNPLMTAAAGGGTPSVGPNGQSAVTASNGPLALVPQTATSTVKLASGWSIVYDAAGRPIKFVPPGG